MIRFRLPLRFSLRTFFVLVTLCCAYLGREWQVVQERKEVLAWLREHHCECTSWFYRVHPQPSGMFYARVSWLRKLLGDTGLIQVRMPPELSHEQARIQRVFPDADVDLRQPPQWPWLVR